MGIAVPPEGLKRWLDILGGVAFVVVCLAVTGSVLLDRFDAKAPVARAEAAPKHPLPTEPVPIEGAQLLGETTARIVMLVYSDFQCPFCSRFATEVFPTIRKEYVDSGRLRVAFKQFPLAIHRQAISAAQASLCAAAQGKFWEMHDSLFQDPENLLLRDLRRRAGEHQLDMNAFDDCMGLGKRAQIDADVASGRTIGVTGTPAFFFGVANADGTIKVVDRISGAAPIETFQEVLNRALSLR